MHLVNPLLAVSIICWTPAGNVNLSDISKNFSTQPTHSSLLIASPLPDDPYGPNPHGSNPHGYDANHPDPHDEQHDPKLPSNQEDQKRSGPKDAYGNSK